MTSSIHAPMQCFQNAPAHFIMTVGYICKMFMILRPELRKLPAGMGLCWSSTTVDPSPSENIIKLLCFWQVGIKAWCNVPKSSEVRIIALRIAIDNADNKLSAKIYGLFYGLALIVGVNIADRFVDKKCMQ
jgi:hypothetical protein